MANLDGSERKTKRFLSFNEQKEVELLVRKGVRYTEIAKQFNISEGAISNFARMSLGIQKKNVTPPPMA